LRGLSEKPNEAEANWKQIKQTQQNKTKRSMLRAGGGKKNQKYPTKNTVQEASLEHTLAAF